MVKKADKEKISSPTKYAVNLLRLLSTAPKWWKKKLKKRYGIKKRIAVSKLSFAFWSKPIGILMSIGIKTKQSIARLTERIVVKVKSKPASLLNSSSPFCLAKIKLGIPKESKTSAKMRKRPISERAIKKASV